jgi:FKBP-type peptidyl-prolyl cis-trans isomerase
MKHNMKWATLVVAGAAMMFACKSENKDQFDSISEGLSYQMEKENPSGQQVQEGDVLVGEMTVKFDDSLIFDTKGKVQRIALANPNWEVKVGEGLLKMHVGEIATFAIDADLMAKYLNPNQMPTNYKAGTNQKIYYRINLQDIVTREELQQEQSNYENNMREMEQEEPEAIAEYIKANNITVQPNADGLYVVVKKKGNGPKVTMGKQVSVNYTGRLLDGTIFDSSVESDARTGNVYDARRQYEPFTFQIGAGQVMSGWDNGLLNQTVGTTLQLIIPSKEAYGSRGAGNRIPPYSPLVFDIEIVSVK